MATAEDFADAVMAECLGGKGQAEKFLEFASAYKQPDRVPEIQKEIVRILGTLSDYEQIRRWQYLASFLNSFYWESRLPNYRKGEIIRTSDV